MSRRVSHPPLTEEQRRLAESCVPLARSLANPFKARAPQAWEEFESAAMLALVVAAAKFDPDRGLEFTTYAYYKVRGALLTCLRHLKADRVQSGLGPAEAIDAVCRRPDPADEIAGAEAIESHLRRLPRRYAEACRLIYRDGLSHVEAARKLGTSKSNMSMMHKRAMAMLRDQGVR